MYGKSAIILITMHSVEKTDFVFTGRTLGALGRVIDRDYC